MIVSRAPGKLFIAGEYAVVEPGEPAVLVAVDRYLTARLTSARGSGRVRSGRSLLAWRRDGHGIAVTAGRNDYVAAAIRAVEELRAAHGLPARYFDLDLTSALIDADGRKLGLGSSAAVVVAIVSALDRFHGLALTALQRFRLALLATIEVSPAASGGDLAAATFGGWIHYTSPDRVALAARRADGGLVEALDSDAWDGCGVLPLPAPESLQLLVGWTGEPASTPRLVAGVRRPRDVASYGDFVSGSRTCVADLVAGLGRGDVAGPIRRARALLQGLAGDTGIQIETAALKRLCDIAERHGAAAKPSGAGGGDCGVALARQGHPMIDMLREWESNDIRPLDLAVCPGGSTSDD